MQTKQKLSKKVTVRSRTHGGLPAAGLVWVISQKMGPVSKKTNQVALVSVMGEGGALGWCGSYLKKANQVPLVTVMGEGGALRFAANQY